MTSPLGTYSFLPWLRQGLANQITSADLDESVLGRAGIIVDVELTGARLDGGTATEPITRPVQLYGPGDVVGIDQQAIVRGEPKHWTTNFEPNHLAHIEFYDPDFTWRYTPAAADPALGRQRPWIALVVLADGEFTEGLDARNRPLPYVDVAASDVLPPSDQLWAWAHVHVNGALAHNDTEFASDDMTAVLPRLAAVIAQNPDLAYSRLICPRKLADNTAYHAFVVPTFETGRLAGLGLDPAQSPFATFSAWDGDYPEGARPQAAALPYYHRWFFRTGAGDFESLVRLLVPRPVDKRVGTRDLDVLDPGTGLPPIADPELSGVLKLGGALRVPRAAYTPEELAQVDAHENWAQPYPHPFQQALAGLVNLADDYAATDPVTANAATGLDAVVSDDPDPLITPPIYGAWHALTHRLLVDRAGNPVTPDDNWVHELNLDPRHRVAAGFGTRVVQDRQEQYMQAAWEQIGRVLEANRRIRLGQLAASVSVVWYDRDLRPLLNVGRQQATFLLAPLNKRVVLDGSTVHYTLAISVVRPAVTSTALRRMVRPRARLARTLPFTARRPLGALLDRVNAGEVSAAPPKVTPADLPTVEALVDRAAPHDPMSGLLRRYAWLRWLPLILAALLILVIALLALLAVPVAVPVAVAIALLGILGYRLLARRAAVVAAVDGLRPDQLSPAAVDALPRSPTFALSAPGSGFTAAPGTTDSAESIRFKEALRGSYGLIRASADAGRPPPRRPVDLDGLRQGMFAALDPDRTIPTRVLAGITVPARIREQVGPGFVTAMAYPEIDVPMYEPLKDLSAELFLPNLNMVPQNSVTLLESNQRFIEAYLVGLNHEFARELLWREYLTDLRGTYFRQFWDVRGYLDDAHLNPAALKESLRDIPPLDRWPAGSHLGEHDHRQPSGGPPREEVVLTIRGELLKRYPTAVVYAHRAVWQRTDDGAIDRTKERQFDALAPGEVDDPPRTKVRTPLYEAKVDPDISFFGFDLTVDEARGGTGDDPQDDAGWFFVIKERPGEPRFGLDADQQPELNVWNDLAWADLPPGPSGHLEITAATPSLTLVEPTGAAAEEKLEQYGEDRNITWHRDMSAADIAYVLFQAPVLVGVHAGEMLPAAEGA